MQANTRGRPRNCLHAGLSLDVDGRSLLQHPAGQRFNRRRVDAEPPRFMFILFLPTGRESMSAVSSVFSGDSHPRSASRGACRPIDPCFDINRYLLRHCPCPSPWACPPRHTATAIVGLRSAVDGRDGDSCRVRPWPAATPPPSGASAGKARRGPSGKDLLRCQRNPEGLRWAPIVLE